MSKVVPSAFEVYGVGLSLDRWQLLREKIMVAVKESPYLKYGPGHGNPKARRAIYDVWFNKWLNSGVVQEFFSPESGTNMTWNCSKDRKILRLLIKGEAIKIAGTMRRSDRLAKSREAANREDGEPALAGGEITVEMEPGQTGEVDLGALQYYLSQHPHHDSAGNIWFPIL